MVTERAATERRQGTAGDDCVFCRIVAGAAPATTVYEDDTLCAFLDIRPIARGHTLVIPKRHAGTLDDLDAALGARVFALGHRLAKALRRSPLGSDGANLILNDGKSAFQTVHHVHLHVVPRRNGDIRTFATGFLFRGRVGRQPDRAATAAAIRTGLARLDTEEPAGPSDTRDKESKA
ncbi:HIT family protein [Nocardia sp. GAS34]|uniref:HIT family protein n=1 Tax=unclassified Nocardia TaxID=2637762 RepID=UPI003D232E78